MLFNKKVKVLGIEFDSEEARREYFRNELRKHLPELKKIDGFPIGDDEDIIALSDPPYYTACPNPWLNDFIQEWETEKTTIPNRSDDFFVDEPYSADISEGKNNPIYNAHSYHTKVPHPAIMRFLLHYTQPGDIVLDGFAGTGMTGVAAQMCGNPEQEFKVKIEKEWKEAGKGKPNWGARKAILGDLSPIASFIAYNYNTPVDVEEFQTEAKRILREVEEECGWMYKTLHHPNPQKPNLELAKKVADEISKLKTAEEAREYFKNSKHSFGKINYTVWSDVFLCSECGGEIIFWEAAVDQENGEVKDEFNCPSCNAIQTKRTCEKQWITIFDKAISETIRQTKTVPVMINYSVGTKRYEKKPDTSDIAVISLIEEIDIPNWIPSERMPEGDESRRNDRTGITHVHHFYTRRNLWVLSRLFEIDKLIMKFWGTSTIVNLARNARYKFKKSGNVPLNGTLYVSSLQTETNVTHGFNGKIDFLKRMASLTSLMKKNNFSQFINSSTSFTNNDNSIDYIFTDPPFGSNIMYSELNFIWESWLKVKTNNEKEAIENNFQQKGFLEYQTLMYESFKEYFRVLKPSRWMTVEFSNTNAGIWNGIQTALQRAGFVISNVAALDKQQGSFKAVTTTTAVKQDLIISCYKPAEHIIKKFEEGDQNGKYIWDWVSEHLNHLPIHIVKDFKTNSVVERTPKVLYDRLITYYIMHGLKVPSNAKEFQEGLKQRFAERDSMYFTQEQASEYDQKKAENPEFVNASLWVGNEAEGIEWLRSLLYEKPLTYQQIQPQWMKSTTAIRKNDVLPELRVLLNENFIEEQNGEWRVPDMNEAKDREALRNKTLLKEFEIYKSEIAKPKGKIKQARVEALRAGFKFCWEKYQYKTIVDIADKIPNNLLMEDEQLLMYYDMAMDRL